MPDFTARITSGASLVAFTDTAVPKRTNDRDGYPHKYMQVGDVTTGPLIVTATVGGVDGPFDAALGGRLFTWWWVHYPSFPVPPGTLPPITLYPAQSSVVHIDDFPDANPDWLGHWVLMCRRVGGGGVLVPFDVEAIV